MILVFRLIVLFMVIINFRINANKLSVLAVYKIFIDIKSISYFLIKVMLAMVVFLFFNYNSYIYYGVGVTITYGYVFLYAFGLVLLL